jgi:serine/threonine protein kinase
VRISLLDDFGGGRQLDDNERISNLHLADESRFRIESIVSRDLVRFQISCEEDHPVEMSLPRDIHVSELLRLYLRQQGIPEAISRFQVCSPVGPRRDMRWLAPRASLAEHNASDVLFVKRVDDRPLDQRGIGDLEMRQIDMNEYEKRELIGRGVFGIVTRYVHRETQDEIAVKIVDVDRAPHALREAHLLAQLDHPCILSLIGIVLPRADDPSLLIATEMVRPGSLEAVIANKPLTDATVYAKVVVGIVLGMRHLHQNNVIHRDLKPTNVLVDFQWQVRIADFGLSQIVDVDLALSVGIGTPCYQSPEMMMGTHYSLSTDVYSFGCMCYEIFTGKKAIPGTTLGHLYTAASSGFRPEMPAQWSQWFRDLAGRSWEPEPAARPTFREIYAAMKAESFRVAADVHTDEVLEMVERIAALEANALQ